MIFHTKQDHVKYPFQQDYRTTIELIVKLFFVKDFELSVFLRAVGFAIKMNEYSFILIARYVTTLQNNGRIVEWNLYWLVRLGIFFFLYPL